MNLKKTKVELERNIINELRECKECKDGCLYVHDVLRWIHLAFENQIKTKKNQKRI